MPGKIIEYKVISNNAAELALHVQEMIANGWEPLGGISCGSTNHVFAQAMVKYGTPKTNIPAGELKVVDL